jgi:hypothetical protein
MWNITLKKLYQKKKNNTKKNKVSWNKLLHTKINDQMLLLNFVGNMTSTC